MNYVTQEEEEDFTSSYETRGDRLHPGEDETNNVSFQESKIFDIFTGIPTPHHALMPNGYSRRVKT